MTRLTSLTLGAAMLGFLVFVADYNLCYNFFMLFIFSEENFIRRYAKMIIEWGYPFFYDNIFCLFEKQ